MHCLHQTLLLAVVYGTCALCVLIGLFVFTRFFVSCERAPAVFFISLLQIYRIKQKIMLYKLVDVIKKLTTIIISSVWLSACNHHTFYVWLLFFFTIYARTEIGGYSHNSDTVSITSTLFILLYLIPFAPFNGVRFY